MYKVAKGLKIIRSRFNRQYLSENYKRFPSILLRYLLFKPGSNVVFCVLFLLDKYTPFRSAIGRFSGIHKGQTVLILGNGPSLSKVDFDALKGHVTFASNKIFLAFSQTSWRPTYYTVEDDLVFSQNAKSIMQVDSEKLFPDLALLHLPSRCGISFFNYKQHHHYPYLPRFGNSLYKGIYWGSSVVYTQIQLAVAMGASRIILLGVDFNFDVPKGSLKSTKEIISDGEVNHFHPEYRAVGEKWNIPNLDNQRLAFQRAHEYCIRHSIELVNGTRGSKLDVLPKFDFPEFYTRDI